MFIAFEGPDNTGKSTSAANLAHDGVAIYNATNALHHAEQENLKDEPDLVVAYDRIDWFSHMVYRLSLPGHDWNDDRNRTVFAMPDTHLVVKIHRPDLAELISDELYSTGTLAEVNPMYFYFGSFLAMLNEQRDYALFKTVSIVEVVNDPREPGTFSQYLKHFNSPVTGLEDFLQGREFTTDEDLLELFRYEEQHRL